MTGFAFICWLLGATVVVLPIVLFFCLLMPNVYGVESQPIRWKDQPR